MNTYLFNIIKFTAAVTILTVLLILTGCRSSESDSHAGHDHETQAVETVTDNHEDCDHETHAVEAVTDGHEDCGHETQAVETVTGDHENCGHETHAEETVTDNHDLHDDDAHLEENEADEHAGHDDGEENVVHLSKEAVELARIMTAEVAYRSLSSSIEVPGTILPDPVKEAFAGSLVEGRIKKIFADIGDNVRAGDPLCVIESPEIGEAEANFIIAAAEIEFLKSEIHRHKILLEEGFGSKSEYLESKARLTSAEATLRAAEITLLAMGISPQDIENIAAGKQAAGELTLRSPVDGIVIDREVRLGKRIVPEMDLFHIVDHSRVRIKIDIPEQYAASLENNLDVTVTHRSGKPCPHQGKLRNISFRVDPQTRTITAYVDIANPGGCLSTGGFVIAVVQKSADDKNTIAVPEQSLLKDAHGDDIVYIMDESGCYSLKEVEIGEIYDGWVIIHTGLHPGDVVVTEGAFAIRSESLKDEYTHSCAH